MNQLHKVGLACVAALVLATGSIPVFTQAGDQNVKLSELQKKVAAYTSVGIPVGAVPKRGLSKDQMAKILQIATANGNRLADDGPGGRPDGPGGRPDGPGGRPDGPGGRPDGPGGRPA